VVVLDLEVLVDGNVGEVVIAVSSEISRLDRTAVRGVKRWKFYPATLDGEPVVAWVRQKIIFE
jgi:protein TonB